MKTMCKQVIWLTGASTGIGRALAIDLARNNNKVIVSARNEQALNELAQQFPDNIIPLPLDLGDHRSAESIMQSLLNVTDYIDGVILNAGTASYLDGDGPYLDITQQIFQVNFYGAIKCIDAAMPLLKYSQQQKFIAGVCSLSYYLPLSRAEAYGASKAALAYFLESLRVDLYQHKINVTVINPGFVKTPLTDKNDFPMPWLWSSEKAAFYIIRKLSTYPTEIRFPCALVMLLKLTNLLPRRFYTRLAQKMVRN